MRRQRIDLPSFRVRAAQGTAFMVTLLALVLLTFLGLSVSVISGTERQIGNNQLTEQRVFYAADTGLSLGTARALTTRNLSPATFTLPDPDPSALAKRSEIAVSRFLEINRQPCNLCDVANYGQKQVSEFWDVTFTAISGATRRVGPGDVEVANKVVTAMREFQPWQDADSAKLQRLDPNKGTFETYD
ncbi:MAG: hypothetical protein OES47_05795 [Acidobacteriota bacterium]|nr:hypothetical protein [Acidobacteriota bacterium]